MKCFTAIISVLLFWGSVAILSLSIRQKRYRLLCLAVPLTIITYIVEQCFATSLSGGATFTELAKRTLTAFSALSNQTLILYCTIVTIIEFAFFLNIIRYESSHITVSSVKIAMDNLATGIFCYTKGGRILLINHSMEKFCKKTVGIIPSDSQDFFERMHAGRMQSELRTEIVENKNELVILLPDNTVWQIRTDELLFENHTLNMLTVYDITQAYHKAQELSIMQQDLVKLGKRLVQVNQEIVSLATNREILNAKIKIHNELGSNLLSIKNYCICGTKPEELEEIIKKLRQNVTFLQSEHAVVRDEYELLLEMADRLGIHIQINGTLPQDEMHKQIMTTAIHECITNTLRHARGDKLQINIIEEKEKRIIQFTNNGEQPTEKIVEKGGLMSLRTMVEKSGGDMQVYSLPIVMIILELPKEVQYAL